MTKEIVDRRVLQILRWSLIVQVFFLLQSSFAPRYYFLKQGSIAKIDFISIAPILLMILTLVLLSFKAIQVRITKSIFFIILNILALTTIFSRQIILISTPSSPRGAQFPFATFKGDVIFFLIIPLVFIAWQYSMREVFFYSLLTILAEAIPLFLQRNTLDLFFIITNILSDISRSGILAIVGWIENRLVTLQREQQNQLLEANKKLRKYALTNEKLAQTQERNRLARELHDTLAHTLSSVSVQLEATKALFDRKPKDAKKILDQTLKNTKKGLTETRRTLVDLRSSELESYGLTKAIRNLGTSASERGGFKIGFHLDESTDMLSEEIGHCLYRTVQETLENTIRHANAKNVSIDLLSNEAKIRLQINDDGKGFNIKETKKEHLGIRGMQERVEMLGGTFNVESDPESGTTISVELEREND